jgi:threonine/homoserine efflux transporter RhtA
MWVKSSLDDVGVCLALDEHAEFEVYIVLAN